MPPHCDSLDGPVVTVAREALSQANVDLVLPYVHAPAEAEVTAAFAKVLRLREQGGLAREIADTYFFETVVRLHREGEGAPFTGLKPAGLSEGPIIPLADRAIESGSATEVIEALTHIVRDELLHRFDKAMRLKAHAGGPVPEAREYVEAMLGFIVYSHSLYLAATGGAHEGVHKHG